jgi:hypothetical protein
MTRLRFTPAQANKTLPLVRRIVEDVLARGRELRKLGERENDPSATARIGTLEAELRDLFEELERIGCSYKDWGFDKGLVDFPGEIDGREVLFCWRSDEPRVTWRTPIPAHLLEGEVRGAR